MSLHSFHHAFRVPPGRPLGVERVRNELVAWLWVQRETADVRVAKAPDVAWAHAVEDAGHPVHLLAQDGDVVRVWSRFAAADDRWVPAVAAALGCDALYGHLNDGVDNWRWQRFERGAPAASFWYLGQPEYAGYRAGRETLPAPDLWQAFQAFGVEYGHERPSAALARPGLTDPVGVEWIRE